MFNYIHYIYTDEKQTVKHKPNHKKSASKQMGIFWFIVLTNPTYLLLLFWINNKIKPVNCGQVRHGEFCTLVGHVTIKYVG